MISGWYARDCYQASISHLQSSRVLSSTYIRGMHENKHAPDGGHFTTYVHTYMYTHCGALRRESRVVSTTRYPLPPTSVCATLIHTQHTHGRALILTSYVRLQSATTSSTVAITTGQEQWRNRGWAKYRSGISATSVARELCSSITGSRVCFRND